MFIGKGVLSTLMALGSISSIDEKCNYDYPRRGSSYDGLLVPEWVQAAECAGGGSGKLRLLPYTDTQSILKPWFLWAWEQWRPLPLPKNKGAVGRESNPPPGPMEVESGGRGGVKDIINAPGHLKLLLQEWGTAQRRLGKVKVASRVMNAEPDPPPDQEVAHGT